MGATEILLYRDEEMKKALELLKRAEVAMLRASDVNCENSDQYYIREAITKIREAIDDIKSVVGG